MNKTYVVGFRREDGAIGRAVMDLPADTENPIELINTTVAAELPNVKPVLVLVPR